MQWCFLTIHQFLIVLDVRKERKQRREINENVSLASFPFPASLSHPL